MLALLSDDESVKLKNYNNVWKGEADISGVEDRRIRFSCRIGSDYVKFDEFITADNFPSMRLTDIDFTSSIIVGLLLNFSKSGSPVSNRFLSIVLLIIYL